MLRPHGYVTIVGEVDRVVEYDSITCGHCQSLIIVKPNTLSRVYLFRQPDGSVREEAGAACSRCMRPVCLRCCEIGTCVPAEKMIELMEAVGRHG